MSARARVVGIGSLLLAAVLLGVAWWASHQGHGERSLDRTVAGVEDSPAGDDLRAPSGRDARAMTAPDESRKQRERVELLEPVESAAAPTNEPAPSEETRVHVFVVDHSGRGIPGVTVRVARPGNWGSWKDMRTDVTASDGSAVFTGYPRSSVWAEVDPTTIPSGHVAAARIHGTLAESPETTLTLVCPGEGSVRGTVSRADGSPIPGAHVRLRPIDHSSRTIVLRTDDTGNFRVQHVHPGTWSVAIDVRDRRSLVGLAVPTSRSMRVAPGQIAHVDLECPDRGEWILGRVVDSFDRGVAGILVRAQESPDPERSSGPPPARRELAYALTGKDGSFRLGPLAEGDYTVQVGDRHGSSGVTRDGALLEHWPAPYLAAAGASEERCTVVRVIEDTIEWRIRPRIEPASSELQGLTLADIQAAVGWCRLFEDSTGSWTFLTRRSGKDLLLVINAGDREWRHTIPEPDGHSIDMELELPPPRQPR